MFTSSVFHKISKVNSMSTELFLNVIKFSIKNNKLRKSLNAPIELICIIS